MPILPVAKADLIHPVGRHKSRLSCGNLEAACVVGKLAHHFLGTDGRMETIDVAEIRERLGMTQQEFAATFGVSTATVRNWEQGRRRPHGPARVLLCVIAREPKAVLRAIRAG